MIAGRSELYAKVTDFGLATSPVEDSIRREQMKSMVGTILYACPEIVQHKPYTDKADIWSLGCLLYKLAMLEDPFTGNNVLSVTFKIVELNYPPVQGSDLLCRVVAGCICADPTERLDIHAVLELLA